MDNPPNFIHLFFPQFWQILKMDIRLRQLMCLYKCENGQCDWIDLWLDSTQI